MWRDIVKYGAIAGLVVAGVMVVGFWSAGGATRSQVEVLATEVVPTRRRAGVTRALRRALATLTGFADQEE